jgi:NAD(P)-dependent dehydrogenase (short-subunit alcohol dehydrogenase family)
MVTNRKRWTTSGIPPQTGRRAPITGANSGIGFHTALELARKGAEIVIGWSANQRHLLRGRRSRGRHVRRSQSQRRNYRDRGCRNRQRDESRSWCCRRTRRAWSERISAARETFGARLRSWKNRASGESLGTAPLDKHSDSILAGGGRNVALVAGCLDFVGGIILLGSETLLQQHAEYAGFRLDPLYFTQGNGSRARR